MKILDAWSNHRSRHYRRCRPVSTHVYAEVGEVAQRAKRAQASARARLTPDPSPDTPDEGRDSPRPPKTAQDRAHAQLLRLADQLDYTYPGAPGSLREGLQTFTLTLMTLTWNY
jgi:hypothetical protein